MHEALDELTRYLLGVVAVALGAAAVAWHGAPGDPASGRRPWRRLLPGVLVAASALYLAYLAAVLVPALWERAARRDDAVRYYVITTRALHGLPLYWPWPGYGPQIGTPGFPYPPERYPYPPFFVAFLAPIAKLPLLAYARAWYVVLYVAFVAYAACLARLATGRVTLPRVVVAAGVLAAVPGSQLALMVANVEPVLWALFGAALAFPHLRGAGFMGSAMVKLYGGWALLLAAWREGWPVVRSAAVALGAGLAAGFLVFGPGTFLGWFLDWARYMVPVVGQGTFAVDPQYGGTNVSLSFGGLRAVRALGWEYHPGPLPQWARLYLTVMAVGAPLVTMWLWRRAEPVLRYALVTVAAVLFAPLCWATYLPLLLAPLAIVAGRWRRRGAGEPVAA